MGTRHLTCVVHKGEYRIAQYGQWDGYPKGQGKTVIGFLIVADIERFKMQVEKTAWATQEQLEAQWVKAGAKKGSTLVNFDVIKKYDKLYPENSRNTGAGVLLLIMKNKKKKILLQNNIDFAQDSLFCEWAYVIDLDAGVLEVYRGFNKQGVSEGERFYAKKPNKDGYYPIKLFKTFTFAELKEVGLSQAVKQLLELSGENE